MFFGKKRICDETCFGVLCTISVGKKNIAGGDLFFDWPEWTQRRRGRAMRVGRYACVDADWVGIARELLERKMPETRAAGADLRLMFLVRAFGGDNLQSGEAFCEVE